VRRLAPRPLAEALKGVARDASPTTLTAAVQAAWPEIAGPSLAAAAQPVSDRDGVVTIACESSVWAQELELLGPDLLERLNTALGSVPGAPPDHPRVAKLRFVVGSVPNHP
jgi:predicted nucleic acid-binding Zn ribbon protein